VLLCPSCGGPGCPVKATTIESLVEPEALRRVGRSDGFRFCAAPACEVVYFRPKTAERLLRSDVKVRVGEKETSPPRAICYCFDHTLEEIEEEVARTGTSRIPEEIAQRCRQGLNRCEQMNPKGACCLGEVRRAVKEAQAKLELGKLVHPVMGTDEKEFEEDCCEMNEANQDTRLQAAGGLDAGAIAQFAALGAAVVASACCWLPLVLMAAGISGGALSATFEAWRPFLLPVTFALLGLAFYLAYRRPPRAEPLAALGESPAGGGVFGPDWQAAPNCCVPKDAAKLSLGKLSRRMLWPVTVLILAFAFFPSYAGYLLAGGGNAGARARANAGAREDLTRVVIAIDGMTCSACARKIEKALEEVAGVAWAEVSYERGEAVVGLEKGGKPTLQPLLAAIASAGSYNARIVEEVEWTLSVAGMTCEGCAAALESALSKVSGVRAASVTYDTGEARVTAAPWVSGEVLRKAVATAGYRATVKSKRSTDYGEKTSDRDL